MCPGLSPLIHISLGPCDSRGHGCSHAVCTCSTTSSEGLRHLCTLTVRREAGTQTQAIELPRCMLFSDRSGSLRNGRNALTRDRNHTFAWHPRYSASSVVSQPFRLPRRPGSVLGCGCELQVSPPARSSSRCAQPGAPWGLGGILSRALPVDRVGAKRALVLRSVPASSGK